MNKIKTIVGAVALAAFSSASFADVSVIANPGFGADSISKDEAEALYIGKSSKVGGVKASIIDLSSDEAARGEFLEKVMGKTESQLKAYWSRQVFTGKGQPPKQVSAGEAASFVKENADGVAYVDGASVPDGVKVLGTF